MTDRGLTALNAVLDFSKQQIAFAGILTSITFAFFSSRPFSESAFQASIPVTRFVSWILFVLCFIFLVLIVVGRSGSLPENGDREQNLGNRPIKRHLHTVVADRLFRFGCDSAIFPLLVFHPRIRDFHLYDDVRVLGVPFSLRPPRFVRRTGPSGQTAARKRGAGADRREQIDDRLWTISDHLSRVGRFSSILVCIDFGASIHDAGLRFNAETRCGGSNASRVASCLCRSQPRFSGGAYDPRI